VHSVGVKRQHCGVLGPYMPGERFDKGKKDPGLFISGLNRQSRLSSPLTVSAKAKP
jgi:hypothetical protein